MRDRLRKLVVLAAAGTTVSFALSSAAFAKPTCESLVNKAASKYAQARLKKAAAACTKAPGGTCFNVSIPSIKVTKSLTKACDAASITALFGGLCPSRTASCKPSSMTTADNVAACLTCSIAAEVDCLSAAAFSRGNLPAGCVGSPSGAFLDLENLE